MNDSFLVKRVNELIAKKEEAKEKD